MVDKEKKRNFWWWLLIGIAILIILTNLNNSDKLEDYDYCVNRCALKINSCFRSYDFHDDNWDYYLGRDDAYKCSSDLEQCVSRCE